MQQGRPSLCCVSTIRSSQGPPEPGEGSSGHGRGAVGPAGLGRGAACAFLAGGHSLRLSREGRRGWRAAGCPWGCRGLLLCRARKGEESPCWMSPRVPAWSQPRAVLTRSSSVPVLSLLQNAPTCPAQPSMLSRVKCCQVIGKLGSKGWTGENETVEELLEPGSLGCRTHCLLQWGAMPPKLLDLPFFPARFSL